jgi:hypothetical protein
MMGIGGTWRRDCIMHDASEDGAKLTVQGSLKGLEFNEFFLLLTSSGGVHRLCETAWINGNQIGAKFISAVQRKSSPALKPASECIEI